MTKSDRTQIKQSQTYCGALSVLWDNLLPNADEELHLGTCFPPRLVDIDALAECAIQKKVLNGSTQSFKKLVESTNSSRWLTASEHRFVIGVALADGLAAQVIKKCKTSVGGVCSNEEFDAYQAVTAIPECERPAVLGAMILAPERQYREVANLFSHDESMVSSVFAIPIDAARLRVCYDHPVNVKLIL